MPRNWVLPLAKSCSTWERERSLPKSPGMDLTGKTVLITRAARQSAELRSQLEGLGARVIECPTIQIVPPKTWKPVDEAIRRLNTYQWLLFTSTNAVEQFMDRMGDIRCMIPIAVAVAVIRPRKREPAQLLVFRPPVLPAQATIPALVEPIKDYWKPRAQSRV